MHTRCSSSNVHMASAAEKFADTAAPDLEDAPALDVGLGAGEIHV